MKSCLAAIAFILFAFDPAFAQEDFPNNAAVRIEVVPFATRTVSDQAFRSGNKTAGSDVEIAGVLRLPHGSGPFSTVVLVEGSGGIVGNNDYWDRVFLSHGIATFTIDGFTGRGIDGMTTDQTKLGLMNMIIDVYRALAVLAKTPRIDSRHIAIMGFSRGGIIALYSAMKRFQVAWNDSGVSPAAYIPFYPVCNIQFQNDEDVTGPIRIFQGTLDDTAPIAPCRDYVKRLKAAGKDVEITSLVGVMHGFDVPNTPAVSFNPHGENTDCTLVEDKSNVIIDQASGKPWGLKDVCNRIGAHDGYSEEATAISEKGVVQFLTATFHLK